MGLADITAAICASAATVGQLFLSAATSISSTQLRIVGTRSARQTHQLVWRALVH